MGKRREITSRALRKQGLRYVRSNLEEGQEVDVDVAELARLFGDEILKRLQRRTTTRRNEDEEDG